MDTFKAKLGKFESNLWQFHFEVPEEIALKLIEKENKRVICTLNNTLKWPAALMKSKTCYFVLVNNENRKLLELNEGDEFLVSLEKDFSDYGFEFPEEMEVLFEQDEEANQYFMSLTMGKRRSLIYLVQKVKNSDSRLRKALAIAHHLKDVKGELDFKLLNKTIKAFNKKSI